MPYINPEDRNYLDGYIDAMADALIKKVKSDHPESYYDKDSSDFYVNLENTQVLKILGDINYCFSRVCAKVMGQPSYSKIAMLTGVLENIKQEFYRRVAEPYEDSKININDDIKEYKRLNDK